MAATPASMSFSNSLSSAGLLRDGKRSTRDLRTHRVGVRCQQGGGNDGGEQKNNYSSLNMDRRDMLLALGGLYGLGTGSMALANPVAVPNLTKCKPAHDDDIEAGSEYLKCCPPFDPFTKPTPWTPTPSAVTRVRRPAHEVVKDPDYVKKYNEGIRKMKNEFPLDDPRNFWSQAKVHCAYCNGAYNNGVFDLQVHFNWLFLPWHRYYVHFFERILCKVLNDDTFALPYWNFDHPDGMTFPEIFTRPNSELYNSTRNMEHARDSSVVMDLKYSRFSTEGSGLTGQKLTDNNLDVVKTVMQNSVGKLETFLGRPVRSGQFVDGRGASGTLENLHNVMHMWTGPTVKPFTDMGNFVTAARDCSFYCLHSNVDRLWEVYRNLSEADGYKKDFDDKDWLEASFVFCDENKNIVKVQVKDCLDTMNLSYTYQEVPLKWYNKPSPAAAKAATRALKPLVPVSEFGPNPRKLTEPIRALVKRPKANRTEQEKRDAMEVVSIKGIEPEAGPVRFDVYISEPVGDKASSDNGEYIGSFTKLTSQHAMTQKMEMDLGITRTVDDLSANDSQKLVVTLVPSGGDVTIAGVEINLLKTDKI